MPVQHQVAYMSPNGSTRAVAESLAGGLTSGASQASITDLADAEARAGLLESLRMEGPICLFIGSPVYFNRAIPPVLAFIEALPPANGAWAVPFVTYGKACSGLALWQMASALQDKGYRIPGAAKVLAVHSLMWESSDPVGRGHPDEAELEQIREFAATLDRRLGAGAPESLSLEALDYHPAWLTEELRAALREPPPGIQKTVDGEACTECGTCVDECPVNTIALNPLPVFGDACIVCLNCVRLCPEEAISPETPLAKIEEMVRARVEKVDERPLTRFFSPSPA